MPNVVLLQYPVVLTDKAWQKKKGTLNKGKKTGVGESLIALQKRFAQSAFSGLDAGQALEGKADPAMYVSRRDKLADALLSADVAKLKPLVKEADKLVFLARSALASDKSAVAYLQQVTAALAALDKDLTSKATTDTLKAALDAQLKVNVRASQVCHLTQMADDKLKARVVEVRNDIGALRTTPTIDAVKNRWTDGNSGARGLVTAVAQWDTFLRPGGPVTTAKAIYAKSSADTFGKLPWVNALGDGAKAQAELIRRRDAGKAEATVVNEMLDEYTQSIGQLGALMKHYTAMKQALAPWL